MPFTNLVLETVIQEDQDALSFRIWDKSIWGTQVAAISAAYIKIKYYDTSNDALIVFDNYPLIIGADRTRLNEYISRDGHIVLLSALKIAGVATTLTRFPDGYFIIDTVFTDGSYAVGSEPHFEDNQGFLAKSRCKVRKLPVLLRWPITKEVQRLSADIQACRMYLDAAEDAIDLGKYLEFKSFMVMLNEVFDNYLINECF